MSPNAATESLFESVPSSTGRSRPRSRQGCWTCRSPRAKKRCDEQRPVCGRCSRRGIECDYSSRPSLAQRRRARGQVSSSNTPTECTPAGSHSLTCLDIQRLPDPSTSACSLTLSVKDHEAVHFFRTAFAKAHHTKNPDYSVFSIMFTIAKEEPMVMHMVVAMGLREMNIRQTWEEVDQERDSLQHYASALRLMADAISPPDCSPDLDAIYTVMWLMLFYEQHFGDAACKAYTKHLDGASSLLRHRSRYLLEAARQQDCPVERAPVLTRRATVETSTLSLYSLRLITWMSLVDAAASSSGVGGQLNETLCSLLLSDSENGYASANPPHVVDAFSQLHKNSNPLYRLAWGDAYPQVELLDDVENRNIYALLGQCGQLRFMVSKLSRLHRKDPDAAIRRFADVDASIRHVQQRFSELIEVGSELSPNTDNSHRLVANIRGIIPIYHAVVLDFMRLVAFDEPLGMRQRHALREIMNLAYQNFKYDGDNAMAQIAWPLFLAALETDDLLHRDWILQRFTALSNFGHNFRRASKFLRRDYIDTAADRETC